LTFFDDGDLARVSAQTRHELRNEAAKASRIFPIPEVNIVSNQMCDETIGQQNRDRGGAEL
jgi:hypothetical protein